MFHYQNIRTDQVFNTNTNFTPSSEPVVISQITNGDATVNTSNRDLDVYQEISTQPLHIFEPIVEIKCGKAKGASTACSEREKKKKSTDVDTSSYTIEERLISAVWMHERARQKRSIGQIKRDFRQRFQKDPPTKNTLWIWEKKLFTTGSVHDAKRSGRPCQRQEHIEAVKNSISTSPGLSLRARAAVLSLPRTTLRKILTDDLRLDEKHITKSRSEVIGVVKRKPTRNTAKASRPVNRSTKRATVQTHPPPAAQYQAQPDRQHNSNQDGYGSYTETVLPVHRAPLYQSTTENKVHQQNIAPVQQHYVLGQMQTHDM